VTGTLVRAVLLVSVLGLAGCSSMCAGADESLTSSPAASAIIVDDITCERLVGHVVEVSAAHFALDGTAAAAFRETILTPCEAKWGADPPTDADRQVARCAMGAVSPRELLACDPATAALMDPTLDRGQP